MTHLLYVRTKDARSVVASWTREPLVIHDDMKQVDCPRCITSKLGEKENMCRNVRKVRVDHRGVHPERGKVTSSTIVYPVVVSLYCVIMAV